MRLLISLIVVVYLVGVGVALAPTFEAKWNTEPASELFASLAHELPVALAWPASAYHSLRPSAQTA
jgi:hypothetical protein